MVFDILVKCNQKYSREHWFVWLNLRSEVRACSIEWEMKRSNLVNDAMEQHSSLVLNNTFEINALFPIQSYLDSVVLLVEQVLLAVVVMAKQSSKDTECLPHSQNQQSCNRVRLEE